MPTETKRAKHTLRPRIHVNAKKTAIDKQEGTPKKPARTGVVGKVAKRVHMNTLNPQLIYT
jgi:hypothetical protein